MIWLFKFDIKFEFAALVNQFMTSEYMHTYDASLDDEFGEKTVSILLDGEESEMIFIDHPASEMSVSSTAKFNLVMLFESYATGWKLSLYLWATRLHRHLFYRPEKFISMCWRNIELLVAWERNQR